MSKQIEKAKGGAIAKPRPHHVVLQERIDGLRKADKLAQLDASEEVLDDMVARIMEADDEDAVLGGTVPIGQLEGRVIQILEANFRPSGYRLHDYVVIRWVDTDGATGVSTNGGPRLVAQVAKAVEKGLLPWTVKVASADVEYAEGMHGRTYFLVKAR